MSHMLKASRWAGNVGELAKRRSPISSPLFPAFTPLPYYPVYRSAFTPLGPPTRRTLRACGREPEGGGGGAGRKKKQTQAEAGHTPSVLRAERSGWRLYAFTCCPRRGGTALQPMWDEVMRWIALSGCRRAEHTPSARTHFATGPPDLPLLPAAVYQSLRFL